MILLPKAIKIYVATKPTCLHKSFEGLSNDVRCQLLNDPLSGHLFIFLNRRKTQVKMLMWTRGGFTILHRRLERGRFSFPSRVNENVACVQIDAHELAMLLEGLMASPNRNATRWNPSSPSHTSA
jgi:transposase